MTLAEILQSAKEKNLAAIPEEIQKVILGETDKLVNTHISDNAPKKGEKIKNFTLGNAKGKSVDLYS